MMDKSTKLFLIIIGIVSIGAGIWGYFYKDEGFSPYFAVFIGIALIGTVISIKPKEKED